MFSSSPFFAPGRWTTLDKTPKRHENWAGLPPSLPAKKVQKSLLLLLLAPSLIAQGESLASRVSGDSFSKKPLQVAVYSNCVSRTTTPAGSQKIKALLWKQYFSLRGRDNTGAIAPSKSLCRFFREWAFDVCVRAVVCNVASLVMIVQKHLS